MGYRPRPRCLFECKGRIAVHVMAYDLAYEKAGVGALLFEQGVREAYAEGMTAIDLLAPGDGYKLDWADASVEVLDWCRPLTLHGYAYAKLYLDFIRPRRPVRHSRAMPVVLAPPHCEPPRSWRDNEALKAYFTPSFFCRLDDDVVYWNSTFLPG